MEVFIGNLADKVTYTDLIGFFKGFSNKAKIRLVDKRTGDGSRLRYGIAEFDSEKVALKAIKKLNGKPLRGEAVVLREYHHRYYANERRAVNWRDKPWTGVERRQQERRKQQIPQSEAEPDIRDYDSNSAGDENTSIRISGYAHLARKG